MWEMMSELRSEGGSDKELVVEELGAEGLETEQERQVGPGLCVHLRDGKGVYTGIFTKLLLNSNGFIAYFF